MKYIKNLEESTKSVLNESDELATDLAKLLGIKDEEAINIVNGLQFSEYLELANAVDQGNRQMARDILDIEEPQHYAFEDAMDEGFRHPEDSIPEQIKSLLAQGKRIVSKLGGASGEIVDIEFEGPFAFAKLQDRDGRIGNIRVDSDPRLDLVGNIDHYALVANSSEDLEEVGPIVGMAARAAGAAVGKAVADKVMGEEEIDEGFFDMFKRETRDEEVAQWAAAVMREYGRHKAASHIASMPRGKQEWVRGALGRYMDGNPKGEFAPEVSWVVKGYDALTESADTKCPECNKKTMKRVGKFKHLRCTECGATKKLNEEDLPMLDKPTMSLKDIAEKHGVSLAELGSELAIGIKVELEHSNDRKIAKEIALDHLMELPDYYTRLDKMEAEGEADIEEEGVGVGGGAAAVGGEAAGVGTGKQPSKTGLDVAGKGIYEAKAGPFNSKAIGSRVKIVYSKDAWDKPIEPGVEGTITRAERVHTFSAMRPFVIQYTVETDDGQKIDIRREGVRKVKAVEEGDNPYAGSSDMMGDEDTGMLGRKEIDDLMPGDDIEVIDISGDPTAVNVKTANAPGDTLVVQTDKGEEHIVKKQAVSGTPKLEELQAAFEQALDEKGKWTRIKNKGKLGDKIKRAERVEKKKKLDHVDEAALERPHKLTREQQEAIKNVVGPALSKMLGQMPKSAKWNRNTYDEWTLNVAFPKSIDIDYGAGQKLARRLNAKAYKPLYDEAGLSLESVFSKGKVVGVWFTRVWPNELDEVAPPGQEDWIKKRKPEFKKRYGDDWESVLYATAWKRHNNESIEEAGFDLDPPSKHLDDKPIHNPADDKFGARQAMIALVNTMENGLGVDRRKFKKSNRETTIGRRIHLDFGAALAAAGKDATYLDKDDVVAKVEQDMRRAGINVIRVIVKDTSVTVLASKDRPEGWMHVTEGKDEIKPIKKMGYGPKAGSWKRRMHKAQPPENHEKTRKRHKKLREDGWLSGVEDVRQMKPTKKHRPAIWENMLGTVFAMNDNYEVQGFDYDYDGARQFANLDDKQDKRVFRMPKKRMTYRPHWDKSKDEYERPLMVPRRGVAVLWVEDTNLVKPAPQPIEEGQNAGKTEHSGAKKGKGAYYGRKKDAKRDSNKKRRANDKKAMDEAFSNTIFDKVGDHVGTPLGNGTVVEIQPMDDHGHQIVLVKMDKYRDHDGDTFKFNAGDLMPPKGGEELSRMRKLAGIKETATAGGTGAGAVATAPAAAGGMVSRDPSIYGKTTEKPKRKKRKTKEEKGDGLGRSRKE